MSDNTDAGFYADGSRYLVRMEGTTVDTGTVNAWIGGFSIGCSLRPTTAGRTLDVNATGEAGLDLDNTSGTLAAAQFGADFITAAKIADDALVAANFATGAFTADAFAADALVAATFATNSIAADALAADAVSEIQSGLATPTNITAGTITTVTNVTDGVTLANGAVTDASLAGNMEIVFETDFATNYNVTRNSWVTNHTDYIGAIPAAALGADCITAAKIAPSAITKGDQLAGLNDVSAAEVNAQCDTALSDYDGPTNTEMATAFTEIKGATWASGTDTLEEIRDRGDAAWVTGGGSGLTALATGTAQSGTSSTIVLASSAAFGDDILNGNVIKIHTGTGAGQARVITSNTLADDTCNVTPSWTTNPSSDSQYEIVEGSANMVAMLLDAQSITDLKDFADAGYDPGTNKVQGVVLTDTLTTYTGNTPQTADHTAAIADIPTVAEFNARTLASATYFDPAVDTVANVTNVATMSGTIQTLDALDTAQDTQHSTTQSAITTAQSDLDTLTGTDGVTLATAQGNYAPATTAQVAAELANALTSDAQSEIVAGALPGATPALSEAIMWLYMLFRNKRVTDNTAGEDRVYNNAGTVISEATISGGATSVTREQYGAVD